MFPEASIRPSLPKNFAKFRGGLSLQAWWFLEVSSPNNLLYPVKFAVKKGLINDDDAEIKESVLVQNKTLLPGQNRYSRAGKTLARWAGSQ